MQRKPFDIITPFLSILAIALLAPGCSPDPAKAKVKYLESGRRYMEKGDTEQAILEFQNAIKQAPRFTDAFVELGRAYMALHDAAHAYSALQQVILLEPGRLDAHLSMSELYLQMRMYPKAEEEASFVISKDSANSKGYEMLGLSLVRQLQTDAAVEAFSKSLKLQPSNSVGYMNLGLAELTLKQYSAADENLRKAIELDPHSVAAYTNLANLDRIQNNLPAGEEALQKGIEKNPDETELYLTWAEFLYSERKKADAEAVLDKLRTRKQKSVQTAMAIGDFYFHRQENDKAIAEYRRGNAIDGKNTEIQNHWVTCLLAENRIDEAERINSFTLKQRPKDVAAGIAKGRILISKNKAGEAADWLQVVLTQAPESPIIHYWLAIAYREDQRFPQAKTELQSALRIDPKLTDASRSLAELHLDLGEISEARDAAERLAQLESATPSDRLLLAKIYLRQNSPVKAREQLLLARAAAPNSGEIALSLAQAYQSERKFPEAEGVLESALKEQPGYIPALQALANLYIVRNQREKAVARLERQVKEHPDDANTHLLLGGIQARGNQVAAAKLELTRALELDPKLLQAALELGSIYEKEARPDLAIQEYEKVLQTVPKVAFLHTLVADLYEKQNRRDLAIKHYQLALSIDPNFVQALNNLAWQYASEGQNLDVALGMAQKAKQLQPESAVATDTLAWIQYKKGLYAGAIPLLQDCVAKSPDSPLYHYHLGAALFASGEKQQAKPQLEAAMRLKLTDGTAEDARRLLAQLR